jgi:predicted O-methyltransferase YrrM
VIISGEELEICAATPARARCGRLADVDETLLKIAEDAKGFMPTDEGTALHDAAALAVKRFPGGVLGEIGTYCGKSTLFLAGAVKAAGSGTVVTVDHHIGSEENQPGWEWHDESMVDPHARRLDTLPTLRRTLYDAKVEDVVVAVIGKSQAVGALWSTPLAFLFLDGGHTEEQAQADYEAWARHVAPGGILVIHDVFETAAEGGQAPFHVWERALREGFKEWSQTGSLRVVERPAP